MVSVNNIVTRNKILTKAVIFVFYWTVTLVGVSNAVDFDCNFYQDLTVATTYYIYNPEYPYTYQGARSCMWTLMSDYRVNLTCTTFQIPWSYNCSQDVLTVKVNGRTTHRYCGAGSFNIESDSNTMVLALNSPKWTTGGRFLCEAKSIEKPGDSENCRCGWKNPTRIVGGTNTGVNEFPMMAGIVDAINRNVFCGGTIISDRYVLSAAHCMKDRNPEELGILVGDHDLTIGSDTNATALHRVAEFIVHPNYIEGRILNDVAILKSTSIIKFGNEVGPACLPFQHAADSFGGDHVDLLGWGTTDFGGPPSDILQKVTLSVLTHLQCSKIYKDVTTNQICTYANGKDACQMDSGGPVLWQNPTSRRIVLIGIISTGVSCAVDGGLNTRVGAYINWIISETPDASYCIIE